MGVFVGEAAAIGMLILIWTLLLVFFKECKIMQVKLETFTCSYLVMAIGFGYLLLGGFLYNLLGGEASVLQYDAVWNFGKYGEVLQNVESGSVDGFFANLYMLLARGLGKLVDGIWKKYVWMLFFVLPYAHRMFLPSEHGLVVFLLVGIIWVILRFRPVTKRKLKEGFFVRLWFGLGWIMLASFDTVLYFAEMVKRGGV